MSEKTILSQNDVQVTTRRVVIGAKTYQLSNIASFTKIEIQPEPSGLGCLALLAGLGALGYTIYVAANQGATEALDYVVVRGGWRWIAGGVGALLVAWLKFRGMKTSYAIRLDTSSGSVNAIVSTDQAWINRVASALTEAMEV